MNERSIINKIENGRSEFFRCKVALVGVEKKSQPRRDKNNNIIEGEFIEWMDCLISKGSRSANITAGAESGIDTLPILREYDMSFDIDRDNKNKLRIVGVWGVNVPDKKPEK